MVSKEYSRIGETLYHAELENGLHIYVDVKPEFSKSFAFFATNYGGMDMRFKLKGEWHDTPAGVAHFLEHKMFDTKDGMPFRIWPPTVQARTPLPPPPLRATILRAPKN